MVVIVVVLFAFLVLGVMRVIVIIMIVAVIATACENGAERTGGNEMSESFHGSNVIVSWF